jgi:hypothetical protein
LLCGLLLPGGGQLWRRDGWSALMVMVATVFFWLSATLELVVNNRDGFPAPMVLGEALANLPAEKTIVPHLLVAIVYAMTIQIGAAIFAARWHLKPHQPELVASAIERLSPDTGKGG